MIIVNAEGKIIDYSKSLQEDLGRENIDIKTFKTIQDISPEFEAINSAFNSVYNILPEASRLASASPGKQKRQNNLFHPEDLLSSKPRLIIESEVKTAAIISDTREEDVPFLGAATKNIPKSMRVFTSPFKSLIQLPTNSEVSTNNMARPSKTNQTRNNTVFGLEESIPPKPRTVVDSGTNNLTIVPNTRDEDNPFLVPDSRDTPKHLKTSFHSFKSPLKLPSYSELSVNQNRSSSIPLEKAQITCQQFSEGKTLVFYSLAQQARRSRFAIDVQVKPHILEENTCKVITLRNLRKDMSSVKKNSEIVFFKDGEFSNIKYMDESAITEEKSMIDHSAEIPTQKIQLLVKNNEERPLLFSKTRDSDDIPPTEKIGLGLSNNFNDLVETKTEAAFKRQSYLNFTNKEAKAARIIEALSSNKKLQPALKFSMVGVCFMMALIIALLSFNLYYSKASIQETGLSVRLVYMTAQRLRYTMKLWQFSLFFYANSIGAIYYPPATIKLYRESLLIDVDYLVAANNLLRNELPSLKRTSFFDLS